MPTGEFIYQDGDRRALPAFRISKYPVTYCQFQAFIDAPNGYSNLEWWEGLHPDGLAQQLKGPGNQCFKFDSNPRENVTWYEAIVFCRWLTANLGYEILLPTEQQWEKAARGTGGRIYPYGDEFEVAKANTKESGIGQTTAVGVFADGASPFGALDMSGNVWEWTLTEYQYKSDTCISSHGRRVVRGGSWNYDQAMARATVRNSYDPVTRFNGIGYFGFRLVSQANTSEV